MGKITQKTRFSRLKCLKTLFSGFWETQIFGQKFKIPASMSTIGKKHTIKSLRAIAKKLSIALPSKATRYHRYFVDLPQ